jgi:autotransporter-associated beta strand protein
MLRTGMGMLVLLVGCNEVHAFATCTWTGGDGANFNWNNADNWDTCGGIRSVPLDTDTLVFPDSAPTASKTNTNDLVNLKPATIQLGGQAYNISGNAITLSTAITADTGAGISGPKFAPAINLSSGATFSCQAGFFLYVTGALNLNTFGFAVDGPCNTSIKGPISGSGGLFKYGSGALYLQTGANTYTGATTINNGTIYAGSDNVLGAAGPGNATTIKTTASLTLYLDVSIPESLNLDGGTLDNYLGDNRVTGGVSLISESFVSAAAGTRLTLAGPLAGNALKLNKIGAGTVVIEDASNIGYLAVGGGVLELNGDADGGSINPGTLSGKGPMTNTLVLNSGARMSPGSAGGKNPGTFSGIRFNWQNDGICEFQLGNRADQIALSVGFSKVGSGTYEFEFHDGSTPPKVGVAYPLITFTSPPNFLVSDFSFTYLGTGQGSVLTGTFALTANALTFTPAIVASDLIFRDGVDP